VAAPGTDLPWPIVTKHRMLGLSTSVTSETMTNNLTVELDVDGIAQDSTGTEIY